MTTQRKRYTFTLPPEKVEAMRRRCRRVHKPKPNLSAAVEAALDLWLASKETP